MVGVGLAFGVLGPGPQSVRSSSRPRVAAWKAQQDAARAQAAEQATQAKTGRVRVGANKMLADFRANAPMVDMHLHGRTRGHHKFTVVSMVSRRAGRTFSDLACGTGMHRIHHGARIHHDLPPARRTAGHAGAGPSHRARGPPAGFVQDPKPGGQLLPERAAPMNHMIAVRRYAAGDAPAAAAIIRGLPDHFTGEVPGQVERDAASHEAWVLTDSGAVAGIAVAARKSPDGAEILRIAVDAAQRGRGHGTRLLSHVLDCLAATGGQRRGGQDPGPLIRLPPLRGYVGLLGTQRLHPDRHDRPAARVAARQPGGNLRSRSPPNPITNGSPHCPRGPYRRNRVPVTFSAIPVRSR